VGYSQGAGVMHAAADKIPRSLYSKIKSLVMFGDGYYRLGDILSRFPTGLNEKVKQVCADGDPVSTFRIVMMSIATLAHQLYADRIHRPAIEMENAPTII
jgi:hypothetical protein